MIFIMYFTLSISCTPCLRIPKNTPSAHWVMSFSRFHRTCAKISLPVWQRLPHNHQPGTDPVWEAAARRPPGLHREEGQHDNSLAHDWFIQQGCGAIVHRSHPRSVLVWATHFTPWRHVIYSFEFRGSVHPKIKNTHFPLSCSAISI